MSNNKEDNKNKSNISGKPEKPNKSESQKSTKDQKKTEDKKVLRVSKNFEEKCNIKPAVDESSNFNEKIEKQLNEISPYQNIEITDDNIEKIENLVYVAESLVNGCVYDDNIYTDNNFLNLMHIYQKISLKIETYKLEKNINNLKKTSEDLDKRQKALDKKQEETDKKQEETDKKQEELDKKQEELDKKQKETDKKQEELDKKQEETDKKQKEIDKKQEEVKKKQKSLEEKNDNLVYNLLGFLTAFSIISASVEAINKLGSISNMLLFIVFILFVLVTTLIALNNFYKNKEDEKNLLDRNSFLWTILLVLLIIIAIYWFGKNVVPSFKNEINSFGESIGRGIEKERLKNNP